MSFSLFIKFQHEILLMVNQGKNLAVYTKSEKNVFTFIVLVKKSCRNYKKSQGTFFTKAVRTLAFYPDWSEDFRLNICCILLDSVDKYELLIKIW